MSIIADALSSSSVASASDFQEISLGIIELTGQERQVILSGSCMPFAPIGYGIEQAITETKYPGTSKKTIHVMGANLMPTTFHGHWSAEMLSEKPIYLKKKAVDTRIDTPSAARQLFNDILVSGQKLIVYYTAPAQFLWQALPASVTRIGIMTGFKVDEHKWSSMDWEVSFAWDEAELTVNPVPILPSSIRIGNLLTMINNVVKQVNAFANDILSDMRDVTDGITGYLKAIETAVEDLTNIVEDIASLPAETASQVLDGLNGIKGTFDEMVGSANSVSTAYTNVGDQWNTLVSDKTAIDVFFGDKDEADGADQVGKAEAVSSLKAQLDAIQYEIEVQIRNCKAILENAIISDVYVIGSQGDSFQKWAVEYGFKNWLTIAIANGLYEDVVEIGKMYRIPMSQKEK